MVKVTWRAATQIREAAQWWSENRPAAPGALRDALDQAFALISHQPEIGAEATNLKLIGVRRVYLSRVRYHLYYRARPSRIEVLALWHTSRGTGPAL